MQIKNKDDRDLFWDALAREDIRDGLNGRESDDETDVWALAERPPRYKKKKRPRKRE